MDATSDHPASPFRILSPRDAPAALGPLDLVIEGSAFGSGRHPTTVSCLALLAELAPLGGSVLDLGSGSGILGIAALRLGAGRAVCVDVNPDAVETARRNGVASGVDDRLEHRCGSADGLPAGAFDLVVANIGGELLLDEAGRVVSLARAGGRLLLSGVLREFAGDLERAYVRLGCAVLARRFPDAFCTVLLSRGA
jgi:ribosomal protein L11 methyltransferase